MKKNGLLMRLLCFAAVLLLALGCALAYASEGGEGEGEGGETPHNEADGNKIEGVKIVWNTPDTRDNGDPDDLWLSTRSRSNLSMKFTLQVTLSGEAESGNYAPGALRIKMPKQIWHPRDTSGEPGATLDSRFGKLDMPIGIKPSPSSDWYYEQTTEEDENGNPVDYYVLINSKEVSATSSHTFECTIFDIDPTRIVDELRSEDLMVHVDALTSEGNTIWEESNTLTAQIDTGERVTGASKNSKFYEFLDEDGGVPANIQALVPEGTSPSDYVYVRWSTYANLSGNQYYDLAMTDPETWCYRVVPTETGGHIYEKEVQGIFLAEVDSSGNVVAKLGDEETPGSGYIYNDGYSYKNDYVAQSAYPGDRSRTLYLWAAYPSASFENMTTYQFENVDHFTLTERDPEVEYWEGTDVPEVSRATGWDTDQFTRMEWFYPTGRFLAYKYIESSKGHTHSLYSSYAGTHSKRHTYEMALNRLRNGHDVTMDYEVLSVGYGYMFTAGPLANTVRWEGVDKQQYESALSEAYDGAWDSEEWIQDPDHFLNWYYTMDTTDRWDFFQYINRERGDRQLTGDDYQFDGVFLQAPEMFTYGRVKNSSYRFRSDVPFGYMPDNTLEKPRIELWVEYNNEATIDAATDTREPSEETGWHLVGVYDVPSGVQYIPFENTEGHVVTGYRTRVCTNQAAIKLTTYPRITLKASDRVMAQVEQLFAESGTPSTQFRNDDCIYLELFNKADDESIYDPETNPEGKVHPNQQMFLDEDVYYRQHLWDDSAVATFTGAGYGISLSKGVNFNPRSIDLGGDNDVYNRRAILHYTATCSEASNLSSMALYNEALKEGAIKQDYHCVWYDLLPENVHPIMDTFRVTRPGDSIENVYTIDNWRDTGRIMIVAECSLTPSPGYVSGTRVITDQPKIAFDAYITWQDLNAMPAGFQLMNYVAYESSIEEENGIVGTIKGSQGESDTIDPRPRRNNTTPTNVPKDIVDAFLDLDPTNDDGRFVYARTPVSPHVNMDAHTEYVKSVKSDLDGIWTSGLDGLPQVNVYEGQKYTYRLRVTSGAETNTWDMILYDTIENYLIPGPGEPNYDASKRADWEDVQSKLNWQGDWQGHGQWRGHLDQVDVTEFVQKGCAPVIYYSTIPWLQFAETKDGRINESVIFEDTAGHYVLGDPATWTRVDAADVVNGKWNVPEGLDVTAIAIDASRTADGGLFILGSKQSVAAYLHMTAPDDHWDETQWHAKGAYAHKTDEATTFEDIDWAAAVDPRNNMHAYNNTRLISRQANEDAPIMTAYLTMIRNDYTRVGIMPEIKRVEKYWDDDSNHDNIRPDSIVVTMMRKVAVSGEDYQPVISEVTGEPITVTITPKTVEVDDGNGGTVEKEVWEEIFFQVPTVDENGNRYLYTFRDEITGYECTCTVNNKGVFVIRNKHENEKVDLSGKKEWLMPDGTELQEEAQSRLPASFKVHLFRTGSDGVRTEIASKTVKPDANGNWAYDFGRLDRYERGGFEYVYEMEEDYVDYFIPSLIDPSTLPEGYEIPAFGTLDLDWLHTQTFYNFYVPYGDLTVQKNILQATDVSKEQAFDFTLYLYTLNDKGEREDAVGGYAYAIHNVLTDPDTGKETLEQPPVKTGTIANGETFQLKGGQRLVMKLLPASLRYQVVEENREGWNPAVSMDEPGGPVIENGEGPVRAGLETAASFTNTYAAEGTVQIGGYKVLTGHTMKASQFTFELVDKNEGTADYDTVIRTAYNAAPSEETQDASTGVITSKAEYKFGALMYDQDDAGKTFHYLVREVDSGKDGYTYDGTEYPVTVTVEDNGDGTLKVTADPADPLELTYNNVYEAEGQIDFKAWKVQKVYDLEAGKYTFELYEYDTEAEDKGELLQSVVNDADGNVVFAPIHFTQDDVNMDPKTPREYVYLIREKHGTDPKVIYSYKEYIIHVKVYDNNDGTLSFQQDNQEAEREWIETVCPDCNGVGVTGSISQIWSTQQVERIGKPGTSKINFSSLRNVDEWLCDNCQGLCYVSGEICPVCKGSGMLINKDLKFTGTTYRIIEYVKVPDSDRYAVKDVNGSSVWYNAVVIEGLLCPTCHGKGGTLTEGPMKITGGGAIPVFTNGFRDGNLSVTKLTRNGDPDQEFRFHVQFTGEDLTDEPLQYELDEVDQGTVHNNAAPLRLNALPAKVPQLRGTPSSGATTAISPDGLYTAQAVYHADPADLQGTAYAMLNTSTGVFTFFRSDPSHLVDPFGNTFRVSGKRTQSGTRIYYSGIENTGNSADNQPWTQDKSYIKHIEMRGSVKPVTCYYWFRKCQNLETVDLHLLDTSSCTNFADMFSKNTSTNYKLEVLDVSNFDMSKATNVKWMFGGDGSEGATYTSYPDTMLKVLILGDFAIPSNASAALLYAGKTNLQVIVRGVNPINGYGDKINYTNPPVSRPGADPYYDGKWHKLGSSGPGVTFKQLIAGSGEEFAGSWYWSVPVEAYNITFDKGEGSGSMAKEQAAICNQAYTFTPSFYWFGYEITSFVDQDGKEYPINPDGTVTIPADTYENGESVTLTAQWKKTVHSAEMQNGRFDFTLKGGQMITFKDIPAGTAYEVWEETPEGWILVSKVDDAGRIVPLETAEAVFTNEYAPNKASASFTASKRFNGELANGDKAGQKFWFRLYKTDEQHETRKLLQTVANNAGGVASFVPILYDYNTPGDVGVHYYLIEEVTATDSSVPYTADASVEYDTHKEYVTVTVTDDGAGNISAVTEYKDEDGNTSNGVFKNYTKPGKLSIAKTISGETDASKDQAFTVTVSFQDKQGRPVTLKLNGETLTELAAVRTRTDGSTEKVTLPLDGSKVSAQLKGGERILIEGIPAGVQYKVEENTLSAGWKQTESFGSTGLIEKDLTKDSGFTNTYAVKGVASFEAEKQVEGETPETSVYAFEVYAAADWDTDANAPLADRQPLQSVKKNAAVNEAGKSLVIFDGIRYTAEGDYIYYIREVPGDDPTMNYDESVVKVTVNMKDNDGKGTLDATVTYEGGQGDGSVFLNTRKDGSLQISKSVTGVTPAEDGKVFTVAVTLTDKNGNKLANQTYATVLNGEDGPAMTTDADGRGTVTLQADDTVIIQGLPHGASYKLEETDMPGGFTQTEAQGDTGVIVGDQTAEASFVNAYDATGSLPLTAKKTMEPADVLTLTEGEFNFEVRNERDVAVRTATNGPEGVVAFEPIPFGMADVGKTYRYTIHETMVDNTVEEGEESPYATDRTIYQVEVTVRDNGDGTLDVTPVITQGEDTVSTALFVNTERVQVKVRKQWQGDAEHKALRPTFIVVHLYADGEELLTRVMNAERQGTADPDLWELTINNLPKYRDGKLIEYTVEEEPVTHYVTVSERDGYTTTLTNVYIETTADIEGVKSLVNRRTGETVAMEDGQFRVEISAVDPASPLPAETVADVAADGSFRFADIPFTLDDLGLTGDGDYQDTNTHTYLVREIIPETVNEINQEKDTEIVYDDTVREVTVTLTLDRKNLSISAEVKPAAEEVSFVNELWEHEGSVIITAVKQVENHALTDGKFSFELVEETDGEETVVATGTNDEKGLVTMSPVQYTHADVDHETGLGTKIYLLREVQDEQPGYALDGHAETVTVSLTENLDGTITAVADKSGAEMTFVNTYDASGSVQLTACKVMEGRNLAEGEYTFELLEDGAVIDTASNAADGSVTFRRIAYGLADIGTKTYEIREAVDGEDADGLAYDRHTETVKVTITDNDDGTLSAVPDKEGMDVTFTNTYTAEGSLTVKVSKALSGRRLEEGQFTFRLLAEDKETVLAEGVNDAEGKLTFHTAEGEEYTLAYTAEDLYDEEAGEYMNPRTVKYYVQEAEPEKDCYTLNAPNPMEISVTLTDDGKGHISTDCPEDTVTVLMQNAYHAEGEIPLTAKKVLSGRALEAEQFTFELLEGETVLGTAKNDADGAVTFEALHYTEADVDEATHTGEKAYTIREVKGDAAGYTYAENIETVTVTLTDNGNGTITAKADKSGAEVTFTNTYQAEGEIPLTAKKVLNGHMLEAEQFTFELLEGETVLQTAKNGADGAVAFEALHYTEADVDEASHTGEKVYTIREVNEGAAGYTYAEPVTVKVTLTDNGDGTITAEADKSGADAALINTYNAEGSLTVKVNKALSGRKLEERQFTFRLLAENKETVLAEGMNDAEGKLTFHTAEGEEYTLAYTIEDLYDAETGKYLTTKTVKYYVMELEPETDGYILNAPNPMEISATLTDDGKGHISTDCPEDTVTVLMQNGYHAEGEIPLTAKKVLSGRELEAEQFTFELLEGETVLETVKNAADGAITFSPLKYTEADVDEATHTGEKVYTIREVNEGAAGYTYAEPVTVTVTLTDNGDGTITAEADKAEAELIFTNTYTAEGEILLTAQKLLEGDELKDRQFTFELKDAEGTVLQTVKNNADGKITFQTIAYTQDDVKNSPITYTISEVKGEAKNIEYDLTPVTVTVTLTDNGDGTITAEADKSGADVTFINVYTVYSSLTLEKRVISSQPVTRRFRFTVWLMDADGNALTGEVPFTGAYEGTITDGKGQVELADGEQIEITGIPMGSTYRVTETAEPGFTVNTAIRNAEEDVYTIGEDGAFVTFENTEVTTDFSVTKRWVGGDGGAIRLTLGTVKNGVFTALAEQPKAEKNGDVYTYTGLTKYDAEGREITYAVQEETVAGYGLKRYVNSDASVTKYALNGATIVNTATTDLHVHKVWVGTGTETPEITLVLYKDGKPTDKKPVKQPGDWYYFYNLEVGHSYYVVEESLPGFLTEYENGSANKEVKDRALDFGVIRNTRIGTPRTGDTTPIGLWLALAGISLAGAAAVTVLTLKKRKNQ